MVTVSNHDRKQRNRVERGLTLIEALVSMTLLLVVMAGLAPVLVVGMRGTDITQRQVELLNVARAKLEEIQTVPYDQIGIRPAVGGTSGEGYFESDPLYNPTYSAASDILLSDTVTLTSGAQVTRTVTVDAIDDSADATAANDWDQLKDPNTATILDYKLVRVVAVGTDPVTRLTLRQELTTVMRGLLDEEIDGATGGDAAGAAPPPKGKKPKADKDKKGDGQPEDGKSKGRKNKSPGTTD